MKKIVVLGGGHGLAVLIKGLKLFPVAITAVVTVADNGASTGRLRDEFKIPAVGDLRNVIVSLAESEPLLEELFQYRFQSNGNLDGHSVGNLLLAALLNIKGSLTEAVSALSKILNLKGKVLPLTEDVVNLVATTKTNKTLMGEVEIRKSGQEIIKIEYDQEPKVVPEVITALLEADLIILGLGSLYTSIIPHLICPEVVTAIKTSTAQKLYMCNVMTEKGETDNFNVSDHIRVLNKYIGSNLDAVIANSKFIPMPIQERYKTLEGSEPVLIDEAEIKELGVNLIAEDLIIIEEKMVRHDPVKTAFTIFSYLLNKGE